jgi:hypothetical protein
MVSAYLRGFKPLDQRERFALHKNDCE